MASRGARLLPRGLDPVHRRGGVVVALAGLGPVGRRGHLADGDGHDALGIPDGERIVREILAEADLDVLVRAVIFLANRHEAGGPLDAEPLELLDDRVVLWAARPGLLVCLLDGGLEEIEPRVRGLGGVGRVLVPALLVRLDEPLVGGGGAGGRVGEMIVECTPASAPSGWSLPIACGTTPK